jgi:hypothetical protein
MSHFARACTTRGYDNYFGGEPYAGRAVAFLNSRHGAEQASGPGLTASLTVGLSEVEGAHRGAPGLADTTE